VKIRFQHTGKAISWLMRGIAETLTYEVVDHACILRSKIRPPLIWTFWHNRMFLIPYLHQLWLPDVPGCILSSPSGDGQIIADVCAEFHLEAVRGSSSRKGMSALISLAEKVKNGYDVGITPDGPRGPCYRLNPGPLKLAQLTGALIMPVDVQYEKPWQFKTWDRFELPKPFSRVRIVLNTPMPIERRLDETQFEQRRLEVEAVMRAGALDYHSGTSL
jgi:Kdo2-lipid IVA 3' secondary acyltransferase